MVQDASVREPGAQGVRTVLAPPIGRLRQVEGVGEPGRTLRSLHRRHDEAHEHARPEHGMLLGRQHPHRHRVIRERQQDPEHSAALVEVHGVALGRDGLPGALQHRDGDRAGHRLHGARRVEHVVRIVARARGRVGDVIQRPAVCHRGDHLPGERGLEGRPDQEVRLQPRRHVPVEERTAARRDGPVLRVVGVGGQRRQLVHGVHELVGGRLVRDVAVRVRPRAHVPERLAPGADGLVRPDVLADPVAPPGEAARLANRPLLIDGHDLEGPLDGLEPQVRPRLPGCARSAHPAYGPHPPIGPGWGTVPT